MSIRTPVGRCFCVVLAAVVARAPDATAARKGDPPPAAGAQAGLVLDRLSNGDLRLWQAIEQVAADLDPSGGPRLPTLRRLLDWARTSTHVLHIEMVSPSRLPGGTAGVFKVEAFDPAGRRHLAVIRLCPGNIQRARVSPGPDALHPFVRFDGLSEAERYAEVLAHELAHAEYLLANPERLAELQDAQGAIAAAFYRAGRARGPSHEECVRRCAKPLAMLDSFEAHAQSVEAVVLQELTRDRQGARSSTSSPRGAFPSDAPPPLRHFIQDPIARFALERAATAALERLDRPECRQVLSDFRDAAGRTIQENLDRLGDTPRSYLPRITFREGLDRHDCKNPGILASTSIGGREVFICSRQFWQVYRADPSRVEAILIHEIMHTLGLGENPPSSTEINARVRKRCW